MVFTIQIQKDDFKVTFRTITNISILNIEAVFILIRFQLQEGFKVEITGFKRVALG